MYDIAIELDNQEEPLVETLHIIELLLLIVVIYGFMTGSEYTQVEYYVHIM